MFFFINADVITFTHRRFKSCGAFLRTIMFVNSTIRIIVVMCESLQNYTKRG